MTLKEWFKEDTKNVQAIYDSMNNGRRYVYYREQKLTKFAQNLCVEQVVELSDGSGNLGAWLYK